MLDLTASLHDRAESEPVSVYVRKESGKDRPLTVDEVGELVERLQHMAGVARQDTCARNAFEVVATWGGDALVLPDCTQNRPRSRVRGRFWAFRLTGQDACLSDDVRQAFQRKLLMNVRSSAWSMR